MPDSCTCEIRFKFNIGNFTQYVRLMACSDAFCCCIVVACRTSHHLRIRLATFVSHSSVFFSIQVLWDMTPCRWVSNYRRTFESSGNTRPGDLIIRYIYICTFCSHCFEGSDVRIASSDAAKCIGTATRLNMQCSIDCNITVEFITAIMMGRGDFIGAGAVAV